MLNILMICTSGISTTLLIEKMEEAAHLHNVMVHVWACGDVEMKHQVAQADIILLGPQSRYLQKDIKNLAGKRPVLKIDLMAYGRMDGEAVFKMVMQYLRI